MQFVVLALLFQDHSLQVIWLERCVGTFWQAAQEIIHNVFVLSALLDMVLEITIEVVCVMNYMSITC